MVWDVQVHLFGIAILVLDVRERLDRLLGLRSARGPGELDIGSDTAVSPMAVIGVELYELPHLSATQNQLPRFLGAYCAEGATGEQADKRGGGMGGEGLTL